MSNNRKMRTRTSKKKGGGMFGLRRRSSTKPANMGNGTRKRRSFPFSFSKYSKKKSNTNKNSADYKKLKTDLEEFRQGLENDKDHRRGNYDTYGVGGPSSRIKEKEAENDKTLSNISKNTNKGIKYINKNTRSQKRKGMFGRMKKKIGTQLARGTRKLASNPLKELLSRYYNKNNKGNEWGKLLGIIYDVDTSEPPNPNNIDNYHTFKNEQLIKDVPDINADGTVTLSQVVYRTFDNTKPRRDKAFQVVKDMDKNERIKFLNNINDLIKSWDSYLQNKKITTAYEKKNEIDLKDLKALAKTLLKDINKVQDAYRITREERRVINIEEKANKSKKEFLKGKNTELQSMKRKVAKKYYQEDIEYFKEMFDKKLNGISEKGWEYTDDNNKITIAFSTMDKIVDWMNDWVNDHNKHNKDLDVKTTKAVEDIRKKVGDKLKVLKSLDPIDEKINPPEGTVKDETIRYVQDKVKKIEGALGAPVVPAENNNFVNARGSAPENGNKNGSNAGANGNNDPANGGANENNDPANGGANENNVSEYSENEVEIS